MYANLLSDKVRDVLPANLCQHLAQGGIAYQNQSWLEAAVWGAVFTEAFLDLLAEDLKLKAGAPGDFAGRINQIRNAPKTGATAGYGIPDDILKRADEIRNQRNRIVHETGLPKSTLELDARTILSHLKVIVDWYVGVSPRKRGEPLATAAAENDARARVRFFFGTITPHTAQQEDFLANLKGRLRNAGIEPVEVVSTKYDRPDPFGKVARTMRSCHAVILVGLERTHSYLCADKPGSQIEKEESHRKYTSGWLHLEAGMAYAMGQAVFPLCERGIANDGIFDRGWNSFQVTEMTVLNADHSVVDEFLEYISEWLANHPFIPDAANHKVIGKSVRGKTSRARG